MHQGKAVIKDVKWIVIWLRATMSPEDIAAYTNLGKHKVISHFNQTGDVKVPAHKQPNFKSLPKMRI